MFLFTFKSGCVISGSLLAAFGVLIEVDVWSVYSSWILNPGASRIWPLILIKITVIPWLGVVLTSIVRSNATCILYMGVAIIKWQIYLIQHSSRRVTHKLMLQYKELSLCFQILHPFLSFSFSGILTGLLLGLVIFINGTLIAWKYVPILFYCMIPVFAVAMAILLKIVFWGCCTFHETNVRIREQWTNMTKQGYNKELKKMNNSLRRLQVPAGWFGSINKQFETIFCTFILCRVIDVLILFNENIT